MSTSSHPQHILTLSPCLPLLSVAGLQAQSVVYSQKTLEDAPTVLLDPNVLSADGTVALSSWSFSEDGATLAYALSSGGSDWQRVLALRVDQETGAPSALPDELEHVKFSSLAWTHDGRGLFYNRYPPPPKGGDEAGTETTRADNQQLAYHVLGTPQEQDVTVLAVPEHPDWMIGAELTHDGRYLVLSIVCGCEPVNRVWILDLDAVPRSVEGTLDLGPYAFGQPGSKPLPLHKLVDDFTVSIDRGWRCGGRVCFGGLVYETLAHFHLIKLHFSLQGIVRVFGVQRERVDVPDQRRRAAVPHPARGRGRGAAGMVRPGRRAPGAPSSVGRAGRARQAGRGVPLQCPGKVFEEGGCMCAWR